MIRKSLYAHPDSGMETFVHLCGMQDIRTSSTTELPRAQTSVGSIDTSKDHNVRSEKLEVRATLSTSSYHALQQALRKIVTFMRHRLRLGHSAFVP